MPDSGQFQSDLYDILIELKKESDPDDRYVVVPSVTGYYWHIEDAVRSAFFRTIWGQTSMMSLASAAQYWADRPDVAADPYHGSSPMAAFQHWLQFGQDEGSIWHDELAAADQWELRITIVTRTPARLVMLTLRLALYSTSRSNLLRRQAIPAMRCLALLDFRAIKLRIFNGRSVGIRQGQEVQKCIDPRLSARRHARAPHDRAQPYEAHPTVGMGYEFSESEIDDSQWHFKSLAYYDEMVASQDGGLEQRDVCDVGITERRWDWDRVSALPARVALA